MNRDTLREMMLYLAQPGGVSKSAWDDAYGALCQAESDGNAFLAIVVSILSRVARSRKTPLPDPLHNMMTLWTPDGQGDVWEIARNRIIKKHIESYLKMVAKLNSPKKPHPKGQ